MIKKACRNQIASFLELFYFFVVSYYYIKLNLPLAGNSERVQLLSIEQVRIPASCPISSQSILFSGINDNPVTNES